MESADNEKSFDPTPKLKSSLIPMLFIPINNNESRCDYCKNEYFTTLIFKQKYCKNCLFWYIKTVNYDNTHLDLHITNDTRTCIKHKSVSYPIFCTQNLREWCEYCSEISYFKQIVTDNSSDYVGQNGTMENLIYCKLRKKLITDYSYDSRIINLMYCKLCGILNLSTCTNQFSLCSNCYRISSGWVDSTLTKKPILFLYLPWWDTFDQCFICKLNLKFISGCQKWCSRCLIIHVECRYCLTTNIIVGFTEKSHCRKCKKESSITVDITNVNCGNDDINEFLVSIGTNYNEVINYLNNVVKDSNPLDIYNFIGSKLIHHYLKQIIKNVPYSQITNLKKIAEGGFGIVYKATLTASLDENNDNKDQTVAVKRFSNSKDINKYFLNKLKSLQFYNTPYHVTRCCGVTRDSNTEEFMLIMKYANGGNLHDYLRKDFTSITWKEKLDILKHVSDGLRNIHDNNFIHRDLHSGNILLEQSEFLIGDLELSQHENGILNEIYGVIPYIAPEIFKGLAFSKASDIYSIGIIMWELITGCKPFNNEEYDQNLIYEIINGKRPEIIVNIPECFENLMKRCWNSDHLNRPSINEIYEIVNNWYEEKKFLEQFDQAEKNRMELLQSKKLGPEFNEKSHSSIIYYSLNSFISEISSINIKSTGDTLNSVINIPRKRSIESNVESKIEVQNNARKHHKTET